MPEAHPDHLVENNDGADAAAYLSDAAIKLSMMHTVVASDVRPDIKYLRQLSNVDKIKAVCRVLGRDTAGFDIGNSAPFDVWLRSMDRSNITAGMYFADLKVQYYTLVNSRLDGGRTDSIDQMIAENEWWYDKFSDILYTFNTGLEPDKKVLH